MKHIIIYRRYDHIVLSVVVIGTALRTNSAKPSLLHTSRINALKYLPLFCMLLLFTLPGHPSSNFFLELSLPQVFEFLWRSVGLCDALFLNQRSALKLVWMQQGK